MKANVVRFRTISVDVQVRAPSAGAADDWEADAKRAVARAVNTHSRMKRHDVVVTAPGSAQLYSPKLAHKVSADHEYLVLLGATPPNRRSKREVGT